MGPSVRVLMVGAVLASACSNLVGADPACRVDGDCPAGLHCLALACASPGDGGVVADAGRTGVDAGAVDGGVDAGAVDGGVDAGAVDAGDAGPVVEEDAGPAAGDGGGAADAGLVCPGDGGVCLCADVAVTSFAAAADTSLHSVDDGTVFGTAPFFQVQRAFGGGGPEMRGLVRFQLDVATTQALDRHRQLGARLVVTRDDVPAGCGLVAGTLEVRSLRNDWNEGTSPVDGLGARWTVRNGVDGWGMEGASLFPDDVGDVVGTIGLTVMSTITVPLAPERFDLRRGPGGQNVSLRLSSPDALSACYQSREGVVGPVLVVEYCR